MIVRNFQNGIEPSIEKIDPVKAFEELLNLKDPSDYALKINTKYSSVMPHVFWAAISRYYWPLSFVDLDEGIYFELEERRNLDV